MKHGPYAVAAERFDSRKSLLRNVVLDDGPNVFVIVARFHEIERLNPAIVRGLQQPTPFVVQSFFPSHYEHFAAIAVVSIQVARNIDVHNVPFLQWSVIRDSVTDDLVDGRTTALWEVMIVQGRWV